MGLQLLVPLLPLCGLQGGRMGEQSWGGTPQCPLGPHIPGPPHPASSLARGPRSHGQVEQNPEQLPVRTRCSGIKVPLCRNN